jgi:hypothetical protein
MLKYDGGSTLVARLGNPDPPKRPGLHKADFRTQHIDPQAHVSSSLLVLLAGRRAVRVGTI